MPTSILTSPLVWLAVLLLSTQGFAADDSEVLEKHFLAVYEPGARPLVDFYEHARIRCKYTSRASSLPEPWVRENTYYANAPRFRSDTIELSDGHNKGRHRAVVAVPLTHSFSVMKLPGHNAFQLYHATTDYAYKLDGIRQISLLPSWLYCVGGISISEAVKEPPFRIKNFEYQDTKSERLARIDYEWRFEEPGRQPVTYHGWLLFAPDDCWAVREAGGGSTTSVRKQFHYQGKHQGIPLVQRLETWVDDEHGKRTGDESVEVLEIVPGPVPEEEFTLAAFGLSEAGLQNTLPPWFYFQLIALLLLVAAFVFWRLAKHYRSPRVHVQQAAA